MRRYPPSTIHRYLDLPSTQIIQTHISHRHNTTPPDPGQIPTPHLQPHLIHPPHQHCRHPCTLTLSHDTHMQHKQQYTYHSHSNHRIHIGYHDNLTDRPKTITCLYTHHKDTNTGICVL